jgi:hypothetical protein
LILLPSTSAVFDRAPWGCARQLQTTAMAGGQRDHLRYVRFSNRPFGVKRFQTIHLCGFDVEGICQGRASFSFVGFLI